MPYGFNPRLSALRVRFDPFYSPLYLADLITNGDFSCDPSGNLYVTEGLGAQTSIDGGFTYEAVPGIATAIIVGNAPCVLTQVGGFNDSAGTIYVQLHDKNAAIVLNDVPFMTWQVLTNSSFAWKPSRGGRAITNGLVFGVSSTRDIYTPLATTIFLFAEGYLSPP